LVGRDPVGWRARDTRRALCFSAEGAHAPEDFFEPVRAPAGRLVLEPSRFYVFASRERLSLPPEHAAEMQPVDVAIGELRSNYAGFFDNGFGWRGDQPGRPGGGTPAVLEVRAHDVPFLVEDGQVLFRLALFATAGRPDGLYGRGRPSYGAQDLTLARAFRDPAR
jgi:dCTP deaminase